VRKNQIRNALITGNEASKDVPVAQASNDSKAA
jgi:hypothetical protein